MKKVVKFLPVIVLFVAVIIILMRIQNKKENYPVEVNKYPNDWFIRQRVYPQRELNFSAYKDALLQSRNLQQRSLTNKVAWSFAGPANVGGRISDVELSATSFDTIYAGAASGGVFKSVDGGQSWLPIFDQALSLSVGDIAIDPTNSNVIYVGTGEVNAGGGSLTYPGYGLYGSSDGGQSWTHLGLEDTRYISRIAVHPQNPQQVYVGAMGKLFGKNSQRGLYRTTDGGSTWENILYISDSTGCIDLVIHPASPDTMYAAMWERIRSANRRSYGGITCGIYRSHDGGDSWSELTNSLPNNSPLVGRIGISLCASQPEIIYAIYADNIGWFDGVYKSLDGGDSWTRTNDGALSYLYNSYGWWFGNIRVDPNNPDKVFVLGLDAYRTDNGGQSWGYSSGIMHVDQHGMYIHPQNSNFIVAGNDGGIYVSQNGGSIWVKSPGLPITQFYTCEIDYQVPQRLYGGTQDNGTNRTLTGNFNDWQHIYGGDGFYVLVDPSDNSYVYAEYQYGGLGRSTDGGFSFVSALTGVSYSDRNNWNSPLVFDPSNPQILYFGTHRIYKSTNRAVNWTPISPDLSNGPSPGNLPFATVTTIAVAPSDNQVIYAGTDDGNVWITLNGGNNWNYISAALPVRWITRLAVDPLDHQTAYVTVSGYRWDSYLPHIFRTTDAGANWEDISGNLPESPLNDVIIDPESDSTLYVAGDFGVFVTDNLGESWQYLGTNLPNVPIVDMVLHNPTRTLVAGTYGRSMYKYDLTHITGRTADRGTSIPRDFILKQNYPNPFNSETIIPVQLNKKAEIKLDIYDVTGRKVRTLFRGILPPGTHAIKWDGKNDIGIDMASGTYIYRLKTPGRLLTKKMILFK